MKTADLPRVAAQAGGRRSGETLPPGVPQQPLRASVPYVTERVHIASKKRVTNSDCRKQVRSEGRSGPGPAKVVRRRPVCGHAGSTGSRLSEQSRFPTEAGDDRPRLGPTVCRTRRACLAHRRAEPAGSGSGASASPCPHDRGTDRHCGTCDHRRPKTFYDDDHRGSDHHRAPSPDDDYDGSSGGCCRAGGCRGQGPGTIFVWVLHRGRRYLVSRARRHLCAPHAADGHCHHGHEAGDRREHDLPGRRPRAVRVGDDHRPVDGHVFQHRFDRRRCCPGAAFLVTGP